VACVSLDLVWTAGSSGAQ